MNHEAQIANLLYRYAEYIDDGDFGAAAALFKHATVKRMRGQEEWLLNSDTLQEYWRENVIIYPDGTPRTKHVVTNAIIEVDEAVGTAISRSYYTLFQSTDEVPLQAIASGRYHDRFELVDGMWRFAYRDYSLLEFFGTLAHHVRRYGNQISTSAP